MSIIELRNKYNKALLNCKFLPHAMAGQSPEKVEKAYLEMITTDLNALIQSEDKERRGWISVKDRLPEAESPVLFATKSGDIVKGYIWLGDWTESYVGTIYNDVTHWMPLPKSPVESENK